jgi:hypothetical protein
MQQHKTNKVMKQYLFQALKRKGNLAQIAILATIVALMSSCSASLTDYGYNPGGTEIRTADEIRKDYFYMYSSSFPNRDYDRPYQDDVQVLRVKKGMMLDPSKDSTLCFVFNEQVANYKDHYFDVVAKTDFHYDAARNVFSYLTLKIGAFFLPNKIFDAVCAGMDTLVFKDVPRKAVRLNGEFECKNVAGLKPDETLYINYRIKFDPNKKQNCWAVSKCSLRKKK